MQMTRISHCLSLKTASATHRVRWCTSSKSDVGGGGDCNDENVGDDDDWEDTDA
jgi:hypothetical protein